MNKDSNIDAARKQTIEWLRLYMTPGVGPVTFHRLRQKFGSVAEAIEGAPDLSRKAGRRTPLTPASREQAERAAAAADKLSARIIRYDEDAYPQPLRPIADAPPLLFVRGHPSLFAKPSIAIIGARNASGAGRKIARMIATDLGAANYVITSGLARGIDGVAHNTALDSGTIAVVAGGVDVIYPPEHDELTAQIAERGAIISEALMGKRPVARDFPRRNRLISGLSLGVVVVEAAAQSGTLITARFALEQGREVFAVPGSPLDPRSQGANRLLRDGACLVESGQDIIDVLAQQNWRAREDRDEQQDLFARPQPQEFNDGEDDQTDHAAARETLKALLSHTPTHRNELMRESMFAAGVFADALLTLVLSGEAIELSGGYFALAVDAPR